MPTKEWQNESLNRRMEIVHISHEPKGSCACKMERVRFNAASGILFAFWGTFGSFPGPYPHLVNHMPEAAHPFPAYQACLPVSFPKGCSGVPWLGFEDGWLEATESVSVMREEYTQSCRCYVGKKKPFVRPSEFCAVSKVEL